MSITIVTLGSILKSAETGKWMTGDGVVISGVGTSLRKHNPDNDTWKVNLCVENRVALTKVEQLAIKDKQPYLLPNEPLLNVRGDEMSYSDVGRKIHLRMNKDEEKVPEITDEDAVHIVARAQTNGIRWSNRHFIHHILREQIEKKDDSIIDALKRLLSEEYGRKFRDISEIHADTKVYIYVRPKGKTGVATFIIDYRDTKTDIDVLKKKGFINWFSPKKVPNICDNSYHETKDHHFVTHGQCWAELSQFFTTHSDMGCDLSRWGGLTYYQAMIPYIFL
ncbi:hypothetical protein N8751_01190 [bacterium]|nr:hypothetical protein [bacterium]